MFDSIKLSDLPKTYCRILRNPSSTRPTIWVMEQNGMQAVVKDYSTNRFFFRNTAGRFLVWRESRAYKKLKNLRGVPSLYNVIDGLALVVEKIPGRNLGDFEKGIRLPDTFFQALKDLVEECHKKGIAHCDLKKVSNILLGHDGLPYIVDWGASIAQGEFNFFPLNLIYRRFLFDDHMAIIKVKLRHIPETVTQEEKDRYNRQGGVEKLIRAIRDRLRDILQRIA
jgi:tRNA A-37 threonylcarbamoyl transferase component Bud32